MDEVGDVGNQCDDAFARYTEQVAATGAGWGKLMNFAIASIATEERSRTARSGIADCAYAVSRHPNLKEEVK
jgi:hypothetical protein